MKSLLLGCGNNRDKRITFPEIGDEWGELTTLDIDNEVGADVVWDLNELPYPFETNEFDQIHAYQVLEHCGRQGDFRFFLAQFEELWRILKPDGYLCATVPMWDSPWAWGDIGHTRVIPKEALIFLSQQEYANQIGKTAMTDYRRWYRGNFETVAVQEGQHELAFVLRAIKD